jgi:hypothetical protein
MKEKEIQKMISWYQTQVIKDSEDLKVSKYGIIDEIRKIKKEDIKNSEVKKETYSLCQRIKKVLGMS